MARKKKYRTHKFTAYKLVPIIKTVDLNKAVTKARYTGIGQEYSTAVIDWKKNRWGKILYTHI